MQKTHAKKVTATGQLEGAGAEHLLNQMSEQICDAKPTHHTTPAVADAAPGAGSEGGSSVGVGEPAGKPAKIKTKMEEALERKQAAAQDKLIHNQRKKEER